MTIHHDKMAYGRLASMREQMSDDELSALLSAVNGEEDEKELTAYVYILECADGTLYTGWTNDLDARVAAHNQGKGAKYTRGRTPVKAVYSKAFASKNDALREECRIKRLSRKEKLLLIQTQTNS